MAEFLKADIEKLIDGVLPWPAVQDMMKSPKDLDRFDKYVRFAHHVSGEEADGSPKILDPEVPAAIRKFSGFEFLKLMNIMPTAHGGIHACCQGP